MRINNNIQNSCPLLFWVSLTVWNGTVPVRIGNVQNGCSQQCSHIFCCLCAQKICINVQRRSLTIPSDDDLWMMESLLVKTCVQSTAMTFQLMCLLITQVSVPSIRVDSNYFPKNIFSFLSSTVAWLQPLLNNVLMCFIIS